MDGNPVTSKFCLNISWSRQNHGPIGKKRPPLFRVYCASRRDREEKDKTGHRPKKSWEGTPDFGKRGARKKVTLSNIAECA